MNPVDAPPVAQPPTPARILIVEDEVIVARDIREQLLSLGYDPVADVATGEAAIELVERLRPNLVLMDVRLAGKMDGIAAASIIRERFELPVVFLTAFAGDETLRGAKLTEPFGYIIKPFDDRELRTVVEMALYKHGAEARLRASEQRLRMIVEHSTQLFFSHTPDNVLTYVSPQSRDMLEVDPEDARRNWTSFLTDHPANAEGLALTRAALETGERQRPYQLELQTPRGGRLWVEVRESPVVVDGKTVAIVGALTDITASRQAQDQLRLQSSALTAAANAIVITDRDGTIVWVNPAFSRLSGYPADEALGRNPRDLVKSGVGDRDVYRNLWETILAGRVWQGELVNRRKDGSHYPEEQTITPVRDGSGAISHFIAIKHDLTERRIVDKMVAASRRQFQAVFEQAAVGMVITARDGSHFLNVNRRFCEMVGYSAEELRRMTSDDITHPDDVAAEAAQIEQIASGAVREFSREKRYRRKDGSEVWAKMFVAPIDLSEPKPTLRIGVIEDISERKQAEEALRRSEERYRLLFEHALDCVFSIAPSGVFTALNQAFETITGWPRTQWLGRSFQALVHPEDLDATRARFQARLQGATPSSNFQVRLQRAAGGHCDLEVTAFVGRKADGSVELHGIGRDVTERKSVERRLREQNAIISHAHEGVVIVNLAHEITLWNRGAEEIFGWTAAEALGRPCEEMLGIEDPSVVWTLRNTVDRDEVWRDEVRGRSKDGRRIVAECRLMLVRDEAGRPRARLCFLADITEKKLMEEKFLHAQRLESVGMLAAGIAHDLNNVLAPIVFAAPMLRAALTDDRDCKILDTLEQSARRGAGLVKQILGFARNSTGEFAPTQVKHLARDVVSLIEETFPKSIQLEHNIPSDLWLVSSNPTQIHQILLNLCVNARDAMPKGGTLRIAVSNTRLEAAGAAALPGARPGDWLVLEVSDTGTGIAPETLERIWEPFFTTKAAGKGTGLGLSTVRGIAASHRGFVVLDTALGAGTTFRIFLPAVESEPAGPNGEAPVELPPCHGELILVVDDDGAIRDIVTAILHRHGYRVVSCGDGVEAIREFSQRPSEFSAVITDVDMPRLGGVALAGALRQLRPEIQLLAMSGLSRNERGESDVPAVRELADAFLLKPFSPESLLRAMHRMLHAAETA